MYEIKNQFLYRSVIVNVSILSVFFLRLTIDPDRHATLEEISKKKHYCKRIAKRRDEIKNQIYIRGCVL